MDRGAGSMTGPSYLELAVRAHTVPTQRKTRDKATPKSMRRKDPRSKKVLVFDCETRTDATQKLTFGWYRVYDRGTLIDEGIFCADDLPESDRETLRAYCCSHREGDFPQGEPIRLLTRTQFLKQVFFRVGFEAKGTIVGFNIPFDISRLAVGWGKARTDFIKGGFSFALLEFRDKQGHIQQNPLWPRVAIRTIDSKRSMIEFTSSWGRHKEAARGSLEKRGTNFRGHFADCRTLTAALTGESHSLRSACAAFAVEHGKLQVAEHGKITSEYIDYARRDVLATWELYSKLLDEYARHPIDLPPERAYSTASIGKAYLNAMGIAIPNLRVEKPLIMTQDDVIGYAMASYYGGRAECRIRRVVLPVVYCDFLSMYPTVNTLMGNWRCLTAPQIIVEDATDEAKSFLNRVSINELFDKETWKLLPVLVQIIPDNMVLPARANYHDRSPRQLTIGLNFVTSGSPLWYTWADCLASLVLTGKAPTVVRAIRFRPARRQESLHSVRLGGAVLIDPLECDFFQRGIEARYRVKADKSLEAKERQRLEHFLKILANSTSYGIFVELNRQEGKEAEIDVYGTEAFRCMVSNLERPGNFYLPIIGALITGAARLMLALAEAEVTRLGGTFVFMDTDSLAIVASETGGLILCPGGKEKMADGQPAVRALSWEQVEQIRDRFALLNPYDPSTVPGSILKLEDENYDTGEGERVRKQLYCYAIAAKRYALFNIEADGVRIRKYSEHGLGQYLKPVDPTTGSPVDDWMEQAWVHIISNELGLPRGPARAWWGQLVRTRISVSTTTMMGWFRRFNARDPMKPKGRQKPYADSVKPFNFLDHAPLDPVRGRPPGIARDAPFTLVTVDIGKDTRNARWVNIYDPAGPLYSVVASNCESLGPHTCIGRSFAEVIADHSRHPEMKSLGPDGMPCTAQTVGLLGRRQIKVVGIIHVGKEANELELVQAELVPEEDEVLTTYMPDAWASIQPVLEQMHASRIRNETGCSLREIHYWKSNKYRPTGERYSRVISSCARFSRDELEKNQAPYIPVDDILAIKIYAESLKRPAKQRIINSSAVPCGRDPT